jgi:methyl-accepting chemotaxis protein
MSKAITDTTTESSRKTRQLTILLGVYAVLSIATLALAIVRHHPWVAVVTQIVLLACIVLSYVLLRRGRLYSAAALFLIGWIAFPLGALASPSAAWMQFVTMPYLVIPTTMVASMLFTPLASFGALLISVALYLGVVVAHGGWNTIEGLQTGGALYLVVPLASGAILATLAWLFGRDMNRALAKADANARSAKANLETSMAMLADVILTAARVGRSANDLTTAMAYITSGAEEIAQTTSRMAVGASEQAREVERVSDSAAHLAAATRQIAADSHEVNAASTESERLVGSTVSMVETLKQRLEAINRVVRLVDKIADQTNLLALNAAIEAARAGAAGAGFAVVAEEVQRLAERSATSVGEVGEITLEVQRSLAPVLASTAAVQQETRRSQTLAGQVAAMTVQQELASDAMVAAVGGIAVVAEHNAVATDEIAASVEEQLASIEQVASSTHLLSDVAQSLRDIIRRQLVMINEWDGEKRLCPHLVDSPVFLDLCFEDASNELILQYCLGAHEACARRQLRKAGEPVPSNLRPDGVIAGED